MAAAGMLALIIDGKTALSGAADGIDLCIKSVIPSLFPFFVLSMLLTSSLWGTKFLAPVGRLCGMPQGSESLLVVGLLGGYPVGAQRVAAAYRRGELEKEQAQRLLGFCSNAGPAFFFGIVASKFSTWWAGFVLWCIHIAAALTVGMLLPGKDPSQVRLSEAKALSLATALRQSLQVMANVCGWVILFRILIAFLERWVLWLLPQEASVCVVGLLELANGCCSLDGIADEKPRFVIASVILALGGLCVTMQTLSVTAGLSMKKYLMGKLMQGAISLLLSLCLISRQHWIPVLLAGAAFLLAKMKKYVEIPSALVYNQKNKGKTGVSYAVPKKN